MTAPSMTMTTRDGWWLDALLARMGCSESRSMSGTAGAAGRSEAGAGNGAGSNAAGGGRGGAVAGQPADAGDGGEVELCEAHDAMTRSFFGVGQNIRCASDADCVVVGSCSGGFGFRAVSAAAAQHAQALSDATPSHCGVYDGPQYRAVCELDAGAGTKGSCALREQGRACGESLPELCDGSDEIRFVLTIGGGFVPSTYGLTNPYGMTFAAIDGRCHYYVSRNYMEGTFSGTLTPLEAAELSTELAFDHIESWSGHYGQNCPDAGGVTLATKDAAITCVCGCDGAPAGAAMAIDRLSAWVARLVRAGQPLDSAVTALAELSSSGSSPANMLRTWPLPQPLATYAGLITDPVTGFAPGARFELAAEARALRELRKDTFASTATAQWTRVQDATGTGEYRLYVVDDLPSDRATALRELLAAAQER